MKQYKILKIVHARSFAEAVKNEKEAEIVNIELNDELDFKKEIIGFRK